MQKLVIAPDQNGYNFIDDVSTLAIKLDGGASKFRKDILNCNLNVNVQWSLNRDEYEYLRFFYKYILVDGSLPFTIDLLIDDPNALTEHEARILPGTFGLKSQSGLGFVVGCTLEVKPVEITDTKQDALSMYVLFGDSWSVYMDLFDTAITTTLPGIL